MPRARLCTYFLSVVLYSIIVLAGLLFLPGLPPAGVRYDSYKNTPPEVFESNAVLDGAEVFLGPEAGISGPESIAIRGDEIYTGVVGGRIIKVDKNRKISTVATIGEECRNEPWNVGTKCGRPLGMRFDADGKLLVADAYFGVFQIDVDSGAKELLISSKIEINGKRPLFPDDLDIGSNGEIYWSDASTAGTMKSSLVEYLGSGSGRVLKYDPSKKTSTVLIDNLHFPNGIQLSPKQDFLLVAETMRSRVWRYFLKGKRQGQREIFLDGLPGLPDNIRSNGRGGFYVALCVGRDVEHPSPGDTLGSLPLVRKLVLRIYGVIDLFLSYINLLAPASPEIDFLRNYLGHLGPFGNPSNYPDKVTILDVSEDGQYVKAFQTNKSQMRTVTEATAGKDFTYFGSFMEKKIWRIRNSALI